MSDLDHARQMLAIARRDLKALGGMLDPDIFAYEIFGFHAQQTAETVVGRASTVARADGGGELDDGIAAYTGNQAAAERVQIGGNVLIITKRQITRECGTSSQLR